MRLAPDTDVCRALAAADPALGSLIAAVGELEISPAQDRFADLAGSIVAQQLSSKAAATIWSRVKALGPVTPDAILAHAEETLRGAGLSGAKVRYVRDLAEKVRSGEVDLHALDHLDDEGVIAQVTRVKGIGRWTAEMFLIFVLARPDVLAVDDAGLQRAAGVLLADGTSLNRESLAARGAAWAPYRTAASLYLWAAIDRGLV